MAINNRNLSVTYYPSTQDVRTRALLAIYDEYSAIAPGDLTEEQFELLQLVQDELNHI